MKHWKKAGILIGLGVSALFAFVVLIAPGLVRDGAVQWVADHTGRSLTVGRVRVHPFTLAVEIRNLRLTDPDKRPFISFDRLDINLSARSLLERALIVERIRLENPALHLVRTAAGAYNFSDLLTLGDKGPPRLPVEGKSQSGFSLNNIEVVGGAIDFIDRAVIPENLHTVRDLHIALPFIGNVPYLADKYISPHLSATLDGANFSFEGKLKPFADAMEALVLFDFDNLNLPDYLSYLPANLPVQIETGHLSTAMEVGYRVARNVRPEVTLTGIATLTGLKLNERDGSPLCFLPMGRVNLTGTRPFSDDIALAAVTIYGLEAILGRDRSGEWNFQRLSADAHGSGGPSYSGDANDSGQPSDSKTPRISIGQLRLRGGKLHFRDDLPEGTFSSELKEISFDLKDFTTVEAESSVFSLKFDTTREEKVAVSGSATIQPLSAYARVEASGIPLEPYYPYFAPFLTSVPTGILKAGAEINLNADKAVRIKNGSLALRDLSLLFGDNEGLKLQQLLIDGIDFDSTAAHVDVEAVRLEQGELSFSRDASGRLSPLSLLQPKPPKKDPPAEGGSGTFSWHLGRVSADGLDVNFIDGTRPEKPSFDLRRIAINLSEIHSPGPSFDSLGARGNYGRRGVFDLNATGRADPLNISGRIHLRRIPLPGINPYLPEKYQISLVSADLDAALDLALQQVPAGLIGKVGGSLGVRNFHAAEKLSGDDLLLWESLQLDQVEAKLSPFSLHIGEAALNDYQARVIIAPDGSINLQRVFGGADEKQVSSAATAQGAESGPGKRPDLRIDAITLQKGTVDFTDRHMHPTYDVKMLNLGGRIGNMSSSGGTPAEVDLRGNLRNESPLSITGTIDPLGESLFLDLKVHFTDIELSPTSPYAGRYLGYLVEKGKLYLDLDYHIENNRLESRNRIFFDQLTLGEPVESEDATSLPVRLVIALLKDRNGEIHLDLPVTGRTDDPQFSIWGLLWQVLKNLLVKAATSPIDLLTSMAGSGEESSQIIFPYGSNRLADPEMEKLAKLAAVLEDRPALKLEVAGFADPDHDPEPLREELLEQKLLRKKYRDPANNGGNRTPGTSSGEATLTSDETTKYLKEIYKEADFPKPRNFIGMIKALPDAEMRKLILANTEVGEPELRALAWGRATAVRNFLVEAGGLHSDRIFQKQVAIQGAQKEAGIGGNRVELGVTVE